MPDPIATQTLTRSGLPVSQLGFGAGPLGGLMRATQSDTARQTLDAAFAAGLRYFDTAPLYGFGLSEHRVGEALYRHGRENVAISTKVGRVLKPRGNRPEKPSNFQAGLPFEVEFDYGYDGVMRSFEDSLQRLGTDRIDILLVHDINQKYQGDRRHERVKEVMAGGHRALEKLRSDKVIKAFGVGTNDLEICTMLLEQGDFDCFLLPGRYTLLDQTAARDFLPKCHSRKVDILMAAPYESGILATGTVPGATYNYVPATEEAFARVRKIEAICREHKVTLAAAALQFPLRHPTAKTIVVGMRSPEEVEQNMRWLREEIGESFWRDLAAAGVHTS